MHTDYSDCFARHYLIFAPDLRQFGDSKSGDLTYLTHVRLATGLVTCQAKECTQIVYTDAS